jgi:adenylosuccinate synthase
VRYQGGHNAGHTLVIDGTSYKLALLPSGVVRGKLSVIGNGVVVDPHHFVAEVEKLAGQGIKITPEILRIADNAPLILSLHRELDATRENANSGLKIGTTRRGIGPAYEDKVARRGVRVLDLRRPARLRELVAKGVEHANRQLAAFGSAKRADTEQTVALLERLAVRLLPLADDVGLTIHRAMRDGRTVLLEGAQGSLLDVDHGTYPFVTSSNTTAGGAAVGAGIAPTAIDAVLGVVKAYTTRVGNGPLPTELDETLAERMRTLGNEYGATTGRPRRCGWFDAVVVRYAARVNGLTDLAVTKLDVLDTLDQLGLCTGYEIDGELCTEFPGDVMQLENATPRYEWFEGWRTSTADARQVSDLPRAARAYLERIEALVEVPITYVSVGTRRDQILSCGTGGWHLR